MSQMRTTECPSCGTANQPQSVVNDTEQFRCRSCGMVYYGPYGCDDKEDSPAPLEGDWPMTTPTAEGT